MTSRGRPGCCAYLLRSMDVMMQNSFLHRHQAGLGEMPVEVRKLLAARGLKISANAC